LLMSPCGALLMSAACDASNGLPHLKQNLEPALFSAPQFLQNGMCESSFYIQFNKIN